MPRKKTRKYGEYLTEIDDKVYAIARLPLGNGKYKNKVKLFSKLNNSKTEASKWVWNELEKHKNGPIDRTEAGKWRLTVAVKWYKKRYLIAPRYENKVKVEGLVDYKASQNKLDEMVKFFGPMKLINSFTIDDWLNWIRKRRDEDEVKQATINRDFSLLRAFFLKLQALIGKDFDFPEIPINMAAEQQRSRVLTLEEEARLLAACAVEEETVPWGYPNGEKKFKMTVKAKRQHLIPIIITAVDTAMRRGELMKLIWKDVDFRSNEIIIRFWNSKTYRERKVGMTPRVKAELEKLYGNGQPAGKRVFPGFASGFETACDRAELGDFVFHDLRHTATTRMIRAGIPHAEVMQTTGHTQIKTFLRYLNLVNQTVQSNASQLANYLNSQAKAAEEVIEAESTNN